jgi:hypothetical protein
VWPAVTVCIILWPSMWVWVGWRVYNFIACQNLFLCKYVISVVKCVISVVKCVLSDTGKGTRADFYVPCCRTGVPFLGVFKKIAKSDYQLHHVSVRPSVRMEQLGSHLTDFNEIWYLSTSRKSVIQKMIKLLLKLDKNNWYFTWRPIYIL